LHYDAVSSRAVDGNSNTHYSHGKSCTHTKNETNPWWRVDLGQVEPVSEAVVNRGECCGTRLSSFEIRVGRLKLWFNMQCVNYCKAFKAKVV